MLRAGLIFLPPPDPRWSFRGPVCGPPCGAVCCDHRPLTIRWSPPGPVLSSGSKIIRKMLRISVVTFGPVLVHALSDMEHKSRQDLAPYCQHQIRHFSFYINLHRCSFSAFFGFSFYSSFISYLRRFQSSFYNGADFSTAQRTSVRGSFYTNLQTANRWAARGCGLSAPGRARVSVRLPRHHTKEHKRSRCAPALRASAHPAKPGRLAVPLTLHGDPSRRGVWGAHSLRSPSLREGAPGFRSSIYYL